MLSIKLDANGIPETPTLVLAKKNTDKLGKINAHGIVTKDNFQNPCEITFTVYEESCDLYDDIKNFKFVWCKEWDRWFEITNIEIEEDDSKKKNVICTEVCQSELSQIKLFNIEINTEDDIKREDYVNPTVLYNPLNPEESLLHRITQKAVNFQILHVDSTISNLQRTFKFDDESIYDAFQKIAEEIDCIFIFDSSTDNNGNIVRGISVYDMQDNCTNPDCLNRGYFENGVCPKCGSTSIKERYGEDTGVFVTADELGENIKLAADTDSVKNCFKLEAGDDFMTATIRNCNPNGTDYIWYITDDMNSEMSTDLQNRLLNYNNTYNDWYNSHSYNSQLQHRDTYNYLITSYQQYNPDLQEIQTVIGYEALIEAYYEAVDFYHYIKTSMMPEVDISQPTAAHELSVIENLSLVSSDDITNISLPTAENIIIGWSKYFVDPRYKVELFNDSLSSKDLTNNVYYWEGKFRVIDYSDSENKAESTYLHRVVINGDYENFLKYKVFGNIGQNKVNEPGIVDMFKYNSNPLDPLTSPFEMNDTTFKSEIKKYSLDELSNMQKIVQACIDVMVEQGITNQGEHETYVYNLWYCLYAPYKQRLSWIEDEMEWKSKVVNNISYFIDDCQKAIDITHDTLDFQNYLGETLWKEFVLFKREQKYSNDNYISDGLDNSEVIEKANEFLMAAKKELYKAAELQHTINTTLRNLLIIDKFKPIVDNFKVGNWIRIKADNDIYRLRLLSYEIDYDNLENLSVDFSDVIKTIDGEIDQKSVMDKMIGISSSYNYTQYQAEKGLKSKDVLDNWNDNGINVANVQIVNTANNQSQTWDENGMLFRKYDPRDYILPDTQSSVYLEYDPRQMKIINSTISFTQDNWKSCATAVGLFRYIDPELGEEVMKYGVNAEAVVGKLILGNELKIYNNDGSLVFDEEGLVISDKDKKNIVYITPKKPDLFKIVSIKTVGEEGQETEVENVLSFNNDGQLSLTGNVTAKNLSFSDTSYREKYLKVDSNGNVIAIATLDADKIKTEVLTNNANYSLALVKGSTSDYKSLGTGATSELAFNPYSDTLIVNDGSGTVKANLEGNADSATTATTADKADSVKFGSYTSNSNYSIPLFYNTTSEYKSIGKDGSDNIVYNPYTKTLTIDSGNGTINATATNATNATNADSATSADSATNADYVKFGSYSTNYEYSIPLYYNTSSTYKQFGKDYNDSITYNPSTKTLTVDGGNGTINAKATSADNADSATTATNADNADYVKFGSYSTDYDYSIPLFYNTTSTYKQFGRDSNDDITFNPSTNKLIINSGSGTVKANLEGNADSATNATTADNVDFTKVNAAQSSINYFYPLAMSPVNTRGITEDSFSSNIGYNPKVCYDPKNNRITSPNSGDTLIIEGDLEGNADTATNATTASKASAVVDYASTSNTVQIGYGGTSVSAADASFVAVYTSGAHIKDMSFGSLATKLLDQNIRPIIYSTSEPGSTLTTGTVYLQYED